MHTSDLEPGGLLTIEGFLYARAAFLSPQRWNGWACPYFTREQTDDLIRHSHLLVYPVTDKPVLEWRGENVGDLDTERQYPEDGPSEFTPMQIDGATYWTIGSWGWVWHEATTGPYQVDGEGTEWPLTWVEPEVHGLSRAVVEREWLRAHPDELAGFTTDDGDDATPDNLPDLGGGMVRVFGRFVKVGTEDDA